jgi:hypothetical protein
MAEGELLATGGVLGEIGAADGDRAHGDDHVVFAAVGLGPVVDDRAELFAVKECCCIGGLISPRAAADRA